MNSGIYAIVNTENGKTYIGSTNNFIIRKNSHWSLLRNNKHWNSHLQNAWNKYGESAFEFRIIFECKIDELLNSEDYYICSYKTIDTKYGYNFQNATRTYISTETRKKMSKSHSGKNHYGYGKHLSENHKHKLRDKKIGKKLTKGHINNIVKSLIGRKHSEETKLKMNRLKEIPIIATNIITGEKIRFKSISYAAKSIGDKDEGNISTGIKNNKIRYGYTWKKDEVK